MDESTASSLVLFFYLSFMDDELSLRLARAAADDLATTLVSERKPSAEEFVSVTWKHFQRNIQHRRIKKHQLHPPYFLNLRPEILENWYCYWKTAGAEDLVSLIWIKILGFTEEQVANSLGSTTGTVNYRVSNGLSQSGSQVSS